MFRTFTVQKWLVSCNLYVTKSQQQNSTARAMFIVFLCHTHYLAPRDSHHIPLSLSLNFVPFFFFFLSRRQYNFLQVLFFCKGLYRFLRLSRGVSTYSLLICFVSNECKIFVCVCMYVHFLSQINPSHAVPSRFFLENPF